MASEIFTVGLIQMSCSPDPEENLLRAVEKVRERQMQARLIEDWQRQDPATRSRRPSPGLSNRSVNATLAVLG